MGWESEDCSVTPALPPEIDIDADVVINQQNELVVIGSNFVASLTMTCIFTEIKVDMSLLEYNICYTSPSQ